MSSWQETMRNTEGIAGDQFWQWGEDFGSWQTHNDGFAVYYNSPLWQCLVKDHVDAIE